MSDHFDQAAARRKLDALLATSTFLKDAWVGAVPDLDVGGLFAFSAMPPSAGKAGEVLYLIGPELTLTSAQATRDFDRLMARLDVGRVGGDAPRLARLVTRFRNLRRGVILVRADEHPLIAPGAIAADAFHPPALSVDGAGAHLRFWLFDTDRLEPSHWTVDVAPDGATRVASP
ncbi:MAG: hypothetical protein R3B06_00645 [Kofleriaceae bacterium]